MSHVDENDERLTLDEMAEMRPLRRLAVIDALKPGESFVFGDVIFVGTHTHARAVLARLPGLTFWGDFSDGTGVPGPLRNV